ncbi:DNA sulfur modification protein DndB [Scopulibacillus daqui]|uniref:DNA sulfur modification protein DndB n=1 Tax=Scopulibacillus daqui TaxID=1469162 RepID=A0ABS2Q268_9BACL|nr:DNA sulfur modification protein DndB [Scopulibacillus daqui]MBM7646383.1 DNA sulfur modification protein DndB [Scopulibacillus daqui]
MMNSGVTARLNGDIYQQFGKEVLVSTVYFRYLESIFDIDREVQRELDIKKCNDIKAFILHTVREGTFYFSPFIFSARDSVENSNGTWEIPPGKRLFILDGQHRYKSMEKAILDLQSELSVLEGSFPEREEDIQVIKKDIEKLRNYPISMQIYLNLSKEDERQLFTDINTERKEAHYGLIMQYDHRDEYIELTRQIANQLKNSFDIEMKLSRLTVQNSSVTSLTIMRRCLLALFEGILTVKKGSPNPKKCRKDEMFDIAVAFFESWLDVFPRNMHDREKYVTGLSGIQVATAYTVFQLANSCDLTYSEAINSIKKLTHHCTWLHSDPLFKNFYDSSTRRIKNHSSTSAIQKLSKKFMSLVCKEGGSVVY